MNNASTKLSERNLQIQATVERIEADLIEKRDRGDHCTSLSPISGKEASMSLRCAYGVWVFDELKEGFGFVFMVFGFGFGFAFMVFGLGFGFAFMVFGLGFAFMNSTKKGATMVFGFGFLSSFDELKEGFLSSFFA
ncbi:hypothetical protein FXO38_36759 [Capsicum annuum]|nr:hypothetical protein FXO38_36759 [Capsicum annuum]